MHSRRNNLHNDVVDGNMDEFDEETDEFHDGRSNGCCHDNLLELCKLLRLLFTVFQVD